MVALNTFIVFVVKAIRGLPPFVPLLQTLTWVLFVIVLIIVLWKKIIYLIDTISKRIEEGSPLKVAGIELGDDYKKMDNISNKLNNAPIANESWRQERDSIYQTNRGLFLAHVITPSKTPGQMFDIFIFLVRHKQKGFIDVDFAEFFLGDKWSNKVFKETPVGGVIGIMVSAYGPFLCLCKVTFKKDKHQATISRYIDFDTHRLIKDKI